MGPSRMSRGETSLYLQVCIIGLNVAVSKKILGLERIPSRNLSTLSFYLAKSCEAEGEAGMSVLSGLYCLGSPTHFEVKPL